MIQEEIIIPITRVMINSYWLLLVEEVLSVVTTILRLPSLSYWASLILVMPSPLVVTIFVVPLVADFSVELLAFEDEVSPPPSITF